MIRAHLLMLLALAQTVFCERLVVHLATGGRGVVVVTDFLGPWVILALVLIPCWQDLREALGTKPFLLFWLPFILMTVLLPFLGVAFARFPVRSLFASWMALIPFTYLALGCVGARQGHRVRGVVRGYFLFAVLLQAGLAVVQTMGQFDYLPGVLRWIFDWDAMFKELNLPDNIVMARATGFYLNPNSLGIWALLAFWISFFLLHGKRRTVGCLASLATVLLCQSRGTLAAFLGSGALYGLTWALLWANRRQLWKATLVVVACAIPTMILTIPGLADSCLGRYRTLPVVGQAIDRYVSGAKVLTEGSSADANFHGRTESWQAASDYLDTHPFGSLGPPEMVIKMAPDNQFEAVLEQGGPFYLCLLLLFFYGAVRLIKSPLAHGRLLAVAGIALVINGVSAVPLDYPASFPFWLLIGVYLGKYVQDRRLSFVEEEGP